MTSTYVTLQTFRSDGCLKHNDNHPGGAKLVRLIIVLSSCCPIFNSFVDLRLRLPPGLVS